MQESGSAIKITFLGTGPAWGVPEIGCDCPLCLEAKKPGSRSRRGRPSLIVESSLNLKRLKADLSERPAKLTWDNADTATERFLIDCGPEIREQLLAAEIKSINALLITHAHADHLNGMDDLAALKRRSKEPQFRIPAYATSEAWENIQKTFGYMLGWVFEKKTLRPGFMLPGWKTEITPFATFHGEMVAGSVGYIFQAAAKKVVFLSDFYDTEITPRMLNPDLLIMSTCWFREPDKQTPVPQMSLERGLGYIAALNPKIVYLTHLSHREGLVHEEWEALAKSLDARIRVAYDGLTVSV